MKTYNFVGYGSLVSHHSLGKTIADRPFQPVIVKGFKRVFNLHTDGHTDILNVEPRSNCYFNGIFFMVDHQELVKIKQREVPEYKFQTVWMYDFKTKKRLGQALMAVDLHKSLDQEKHSPNRLYFMLCREAAYAVSKPFGRMWDQTTYTAAGEKISSWIKRNKSYDSLNNSLQ